MRPDFALRRGLLIRVSIHTYVVTTPVSDAYLSRDRMYAYLLDEDVLAVFY